MEKDTLRTKRHVPQSKTKIRNQGTLLGGGDSYHWQKADAGAVLLPYCEFFESVRSFGDFEEWKCFCWNFAIWFGIWDTVESAIWSMRKCL